MEPSPRHLKAKIDIIDSPSSEDKNPIRFIVCEYHSKIFFHVLEFVNPQLALPCALSLGFTHWIPFKSDTSNIRTASFTQPSNTSMPSVPVMGFTRIWFDPYFCRQRDKFAGQRRAELSYAAVLQCHLQGGNGNNSFQYCIMWISSGKSKGSNLLLLSADVCLLPQIKQFVFSGQQLKQLFFLTNSIFSRICIKEKFYSSVTKRESTRSLSRSGELSGVNKPGPT